MARLVSPPISANQSLLASLATFTAHKEERKWLLYDQINRWGKIEMY